MDLWLSFLIPVSAMGGQKPKQSIRHSMDFRRLSSCPSFVSIAVSIPCCIFTRLGVPVEGQPWDNHWLVWPKGSSSGVSPVRGAVRVALMHLLGLIGLAMNLLGCFSLTDATRYPSRDEMCMETGRRQPSASLCASCSMRSRHARAFRDCTKCTRYG